MISSNVTIPSSLMQKLSSAKIEQCSEKLVDKTSDDALLNVMEYGEGTSGGAEPFGGSPYWQGQIYEEGHRRGYLSDSHYKKQETPTEAHIASSAEFVDGVLHGYSTNWEGVTFGANNYPKRAVDKIHREGRIQTIWRQIINEEF